MKGQTLYEFILTEEIAYQARGVPITDGYEWHMIEHIKKSTLYKNSKFTTGPDDGNRPFKNIVRPILNVAYRSEGFDVKDIEPFVDDSDLYWQSFLVKKFHDRWAWMNDVNSFIDELVESYVDMGGTLVKMVNSKIPEIVPLQRLAFCDQTNLKGGPICEKYTFLADELYDMVDLGWYSDKIDEAITMATAERSSTQNNGVNARTPSKYIEVYAIHGMLPSEWLGDQSLTKQYTRQTQYVTFYQDNKGEKHGITLWKGAVKKNIYKVLLRDKIFGRALGLGGVEELFEPQVWTNYSQIQIKEMLDKAALIIWQTADADLAERENVSNVRKGQILKHAESMPLELVDTRALNLPAFENAAAEWEQHARTMGSADEAMLGKSPASGTPFKLQDLVVQQGNGLHDWRRGKIANFVGEIYRDWVIPYLVSDMKKGSKWLGELSLDEMQTLAENVATNFVNEKVKDLILNYNVVSPEEMQTMIDTAKSVFMKGGNKKFIEIIEGEMEDAPINVQVNVAGKQKNLDVMTDKLVNIFRQIISNPQILAVPGMAKIFNQILEYSGFSAVDFSSFANMKPAPAAPVNNQTLQPAPAA